MPTHRSTGSSGAGPATGRSNVTPFPMGGPTTAGATAPVAPSGLSPSGSSAPQQARRELPVPAHALPHRSPRELLTLARRGLEEAAEIRTDGMRYATAHLAALRAAAAVLAARATPAAPGRRSRVMSVWSLLVLVAPELTEWASFFAAGASKRSAAEAGIPRVVTAREADDLMRSAEQFIAVVEVGLGFSYQPLLDGLKAS
jgi:hypothetical protein